MDGLTGNTNDISFTIPVRTTPYTKEELITIINTNLSNNPITTGSALNYDSNNFTTFRININNLYTAKDYNLVFYDTTSFTTCTTGVSGTSKRNVTKDTTLGWILGFRKYTSYNLFNYISTPINPPSNLNNISTLVADTTCSTTLFNYFILSLDDFNQNHTNDGLVTITTIEKSIPLSSYAQRSNFICDPATGQYVYTGITSPGTNNLTQNQIYAITQIMNNNVNASTLYGNIPITRYSYGPFISDVLAVVPIKIAGVVNGQTIIIDGGTLQTQNHRLRLWNSPEIHPEGNETGRGPLLVLQEFGYRPG
jgi:hypothetical protein